MRPASRDVRAADMVVVRVRVWLVVALVTGAIASAVLPGCKRTPGTAPLDGGPNDRDRRLEHHAEIVSADAAGGIAVGADASAVTDFPDAIPLYGGARVVFSAKSTNRGKSSWTITLESADPRDRVVEFYKSHLGELKLANCLEMDETSMCVWRGQGLDATLMATAEADHKTSVTLTASAK